jgi:hypothetical protein
MRKYFRKLAEFPYRLYRLEKKIDTLMMLQAKSQIRDIQRLGIVKNIHDVEWKVFSQWGEDGIIQYLIHNLKIKNETFIEFGVENYRESNTRFLLVNNNWKGLVMDGSKTNIETIKEDEIAWRHDITCVDVFITKDNINKLITENGFAGAVGILSIDIDGNDYYIWDEINCVDADIVIMEYNAAFGKERTISIPYNASFDASQADSSRLYFGASLPALIQLGTKKGYYFIGATSAGNNAFFLKEKYRSVIPEVSIEDGFVWIKARQARNEAGQLSFMPFMDSIALIKGKEVFNVQTNKMETL